MRDAHSSPDFRPFDRPADPTGMLFLNSDATQADLLTTALARGEVLRASLEMMECSTSELRYQPREIAAILSPMLADLMMLLQAAQRRAEGENRDAVSATTTAHQARLYTIHGKKTSVG